MIFYYLNSMGGGRFSGCMLIVKEIEEKVRRLIADETCVHACRKAARAVKGRGPEGKTIGRFATTIARP